MKIRNIGIVWDSILLAILLNMNVIRFLFNLYDSNIGVYSIYLIFFISSLRHVVTKNYHFYLRTQLTCVLFTFCVLISSVSAIFVSGKAILDAVKFIILFAILCVTFYIPKEAIYKSINIGILINIAYSVVVIINASYVDSYMTHSGNYLVLTLPLALAMSITLSRLFCQIAMGCVTIGNVAFNILCSFIFFFALTRFAARSSYIFPFMCAVIMPLIASKRHRGRLIIIYSILAVFIRGAICVFMKYANEFTINRMLALINDVGANVRVKIWKKCVGLIFEKGWFCVGGGINALENEIGYYPHNIFLQYVSEMGILGLLFCVCATYSTWISAKKYLNYLLFNVNDIQESMRFLDIICGVIFLMLNFMKSFSIYDGIILYLFVVFILNISSSKHTKHNMLEAA